MPIHNLATASSAMLRRSVAATALACGLALGFAANATGAPVSDDFWECAAEHPDDISVCCVFYGGDYDERTGVCWIEEELAPAEPSPTTTRPTVNPSGPVLAPAQRAPLASIG
jgi:hypothetical protein